MVPRVYCVNQKCHAVGLNQKKGKKLFTLKRIITSEWGI